MHVLSTPPAFVLSQDQTLRKIKESILLDSKRICLKLVVNKTTDPLFRSLFSFQRTPCKRLSALADKRLSQERKLLLSAEFSIENSASPVRCWHYLRRKRFRVSESRLPKRRTDPDRDTVQIPKGFVTGATAPLSQSNGDFYIISHANQNVKHNFLGPAK